jgi:hypothetical protein
MQLSLMTPRERYLEIIERAARRQGIRAEDVLRRNREHTAIAAQTEAMREIWAVNPHMTVVRMAQILRRTPSSVCEAMKRAGIPPRTKRAGVPRQVVGAAE